MASPNPVVQPAQAAYGINCLINSAATAKKPKSKDYPMSGFVFTMMNAAGQWTPDPDQTLDGSEPAIVLPATLQGQPFYFSVADLANDQSVWLTGVTIETSGTFLLEEVDHHHNKLEFSSSSGMVGLPLGGNATNNNAPCIFWAGVLSSRLVDDSELKGKKMTFSATVSVVKADGTAMTFSSDPEMEVDPDTNG
ncbi:MAG: hypothetical protein MUC42_09650 [Bryobacter sp.]|jgi:hypothetical protein|nr:hypothetical protein [Bryobacter sp.]